MFPGKIGRFRYQPRPGKLLFSASLSSVAFVDLGETEPDDGKTGEQMMLEASRKELREHFPKALQGSNKIRKGIYTFVESYIIEPVFTGLRFIQLFLIFTPVLILAPIIWIGPRNKDRDNERSGAIWWYGFLVGSMETSGAAFIKVFPKLVILHS